jgi:hypothetical protein
MKKIPLLMLVAIIVTAFSCKKNTTNSTPGTTISVSVSQGPSGAESNGATVNLYETAAAVTGGSPKYSQVTNASGKTMFTVAYLAKYYIIVKNGSASNYYNGYIPVGVFGSQTEINFSPAQSPPGVVGGARLKDTNGDGVINSSDFVIVPSIDVTQNANTDFSVVIY